MSNDDVSRAIDDLLQQAYTEVSKADTPTKVTFAILAGLCDDGLDEVELAVNQRRQAAFGLPKGAVAVDADSKPLSVGERVLFNTSCYPMYLRGVSATVVGKYGQKVRVRVDDVPEAKRYRSKLVTVASTVISKKTT